MEKNNINILSTAPLDQEVVDQAFELDIIIETIPFVEIKFSPVGALRKVVEPLINQNAFILLTSQNAVEALASAVQVTPIGWTFFCVGNLTANKIKKYFGSSTIAASAENAHELADKIEKWGMQDEMIFFCGDQRLDELPDRLRHSLIPVREVVVYETNATPRKLAKEYEGILFFSPSAVESFFSLNQTSSETVLFAIGPTTGGLLSEYSSNSIITVSDSTKKGVVNAAIKFFKQ